MLILKKVSINKLVIYISIITLMLGGTGFMLYQNWQTTSPGPVPADNYDKLRLTADGTATTSGGTGTELDQPPDTSRINNDSEIDLTIFGSAKFKALKENILIPQDDIIVGKKDIFKPN